MTEESSLFESAARFGGFVLAHTALVASELEGDDLVCPYAVIAKGETRQAISYEAETQSDAVEKGKVDFERLRGDVDLWSLAREGLWSDPSLPDKTDVLLISAWAKGMEEPLALIQHFSPVATGRFRLVGTTQIYVNGSQATGRMYDTLLAATVRGIKDKGVAWDSWQANDA